MNFLDRALFELIDIEDVSHDNEHINMVDLYVEDDESFILSDGLVMHNSAASEIVSCRNPKLHASFALTGKINNVYSTTPAQLLKMGKITNLLTVLGLTPGIKATYNNLNFGQICISTDADPDGADIFSLLINIFYQFWPELFKMDKPIIYRLVAPNMVAINKKERVYFADMDDFLKVESKYKNHDVVHYKGLGSMEKCDWLEILNNIDNYIIQMTYDDKFDETIKLLFSDEAQCRKDWLSS